MKQRLLNKCCFVLLCLAAGSGPAESTQDDFDFRAFEPLFTHDLRVYILSTKATAYNLVEDTCKAYKLAPLYVHSNDEFFYLQDRVSRNPSLDDVEIWVMADYSYWKKNYVWTDDQAVASGAWMHVEDRGQVEPPDQTHRWYTSHCLTLSRQWGRGPTPSHDDRHYLKFVNCTLNHRYFCFRDLPPTTTAKTATTITQAMTSTFHETKTTPKTTTETNRSTYNNSTTGTHTSPQPSTPSDPLLGSYPSLKSTDSPTTSPLGRATSIHTNTALPTLIDPDASTTVLPTASEATALLSSLSTPDQIANTTHPQVSQGRNDTRNSTPTTSPTVGGGQTTHPSVLGPTSPENNSSTLTLIPVRETKGMVLLLQNMTSSNDAHVKNKCPCKCGWNYHTTMTEEDVHKIAERIQNELKIDPRKLSATKRKLESAIDNRPGSTTIGSAAILLCLIPFGFLFLADSQRLIRFLLAQKHRKKNQV